MSFQGRRTPASLSILVLVAAAGGFGRPNQGSDPPGALRQFATTLELETTSETSANVSIGDLDGDGDSDLVLAKGRHWPLLDRVLLNDGRGRFAAADLGPTADRTYSAVLADLDGDGDLDVVTSNDTPDKKLVYSNDGKGRFRVSGTWGAAEWSTRNAAAADLNGDGRPDVIAANRPGPSFVCLNDGRGGFPLPCLEVAAKSATIVVPADFDGDGFVDLAIPERDGAQSRLYLNDGRARFARTKPFGPPTTAARAAASGDLDGDGSRDLVVGDERAGVFVHLNDGKGGLSERIRIGEKTPVPYAVQIADMNRDGRADVVVGYVRAPGSVLFNDGGGRRFKEVRFGDGRGAVYGLALGDLDGDGYPDVAAARSEAPNAVYFSRK